MVQDNPNPSPQESGATSDQPDQAVGSVVPPKAKLQALSLKAVQAVIPPLAKLTRQLEQAASAELENNAEPSESSESPESSEAQSDSGAAPAKYLAMARSQAAKLLQLLLQGLQNLQQKLTQSLENQPIATPATSTTTADPTGSAIAAEEPIAPLPAAQDGDPFAQNNPKGQFKEFGKVVVTNTIFVLDWLDPRVAKYWQKFSSLPVVQTNWQKVESSDYWKKFVTAAGSLLRPLGEKAANAPDAVKTILSKKAALIFILVVLVFLNITKPLGIFHRNPVAKAPQPVAAPNQVISEPIDLELVPPERGDAPISPEKIMIADIQDQVIEVSSKYGEALIKSVKTNFRLGRLVVQLNDSWYQLDPLQQERLMADLLGRSQSLNFKKLLVSDADLNLVARSPVVGNQMVILRQAITSNDQAIN
ncbi:hypothetical protein Pse7367_2027 [Thalassoporum mexicanum PCC 7367]|uniref:hypothetical protein n=1 Tax=Thalassoporum mexicanum TaxID=3457544 RepID=UPI00029FE21E|nr:hypothetical protein [Pseudanabaena sp. PCC 7367]AFY70298.1 hypothetical protein Pse7367_2027 [Pseudanabaena sp. PCC 7367]